MLETYVSQDFSVSKSRAELCCLRINRVILRMPNESSFVLEKRQTAITRDVYLLVLGISIRDLSFYKIPQTFQSFLLKRNVKDCFIWFVFKGFSVKCWQMCGQGHVRDEFKVVIWIIAFLQWDLWCNYNFLNLTFYNKCLLPNSYSQNFCNTNMFHSYSSNDFFKCDLVHGLCSHYDTYLMHSSSFYFYSCHMGCNVHVCLEQG